MFVAHLFVKAQTEGSQPPPTTSSPSSIAFNCFRYVCRSGSVIDLLGLRSLRSRCACNFTYQDFVQAQTTSVRVVGSLILLHNLHGLGRPGTGNWTTAPWLHVYGTSSVWCVRWFLVQGVVRRQARLLAKGLQRFFPLTSRVLRLWHRTARR